MSNFCLYFGEMLHICSLFNNAISNSDYTVLNGQTLVNNEMEVMWKEVVMATLKVLH
jgi:hypothetical protein